MNITESVFNNGKLMHGDCLDLMPSIPDKSIDMIVTSPPYYVNKAYEKIITYIEYCDLMKSVFIQIERVLKIGGYAVFNFGDYFNSGNRFYDADIPSCYPASLNYYDWGVNIANMDLQATRIWRKKFAKMGIPFVCNTHPRPIFDYEHIWTYRKKGNNIEFVNDRKLSQMGVLGENWKSNAGLNNHCAAFPIELPEWALKVYSKESNLILDPFAGSGTTAIACINTNRNFILMEKDQGYYEVAKKRIKEHQSQLVLI